MAHHVYRPVLTIADIKVGSQIETDSRTMLESDLHMFCGLVGDSNPIHVSRATAKAAGFDHVLTPATLTASMAIALFGNSRWLHPVLMFFVGMSDWRVESPIFPGDTIFAKVTIEGLKPLSDGKRYVVNLKFEVFSVAGSARVMTFTANFMARNQDTIVV